MELKDRLFDTLDMIVFGYLLWPEGKDALKAIKKEAWD